MLNVLVLDVVNALNKTLIFVLVAIIHNFLKKENAFSNAETTSIQITMNANTVMKDL